MDTAQLAAATADSGTVVPLAAVAAALFVVAAIARKVIKLALIVGLVAAGVLAYAAYRSGAFG